jgi:pimeloyl-ACP methyl ester carboxylesterase
MRAHVNSADGVRIAYATQGEGEPALVFIHGGLADRAYWSNQIDVFGERHKVVALDLAGHGESSTDRRTWSMQAFGHDVQAVLEAENITRAVLIGNSLGGPVAIEAALLAPGRVSGIIGIDTFHELNMRVDPSEWQARAEAFRVDLAGSVKRMIQALFHADADPDLMSDLEQRMNQSSAKTVQGMFGAFDGYDMAASVRRLKVPMRCINGDLYPINFEGNRSVYIDFDAVVLPHTGHYPMLECPEEFNRQLARILARADFHRL